MKILILILLVFMLSYKALAFQASEGWSSARALGMGNSYSAIVSDADSMFYNPAGLANNKRFAWTILDPRAGLNGIDTVTRIKDLSSADSSNFAQKLNGLYGHPIFGEAGAKTAFLAPGFGVAAFSNSNAGLYFQNPASPVLNVNYFLDYGVSVGGGFDLVPDTLKMGVVVRGVNRTGTAQAIDANSLAALDPAVLKSELARKGTGYGADFGLLATGAGPAHPTLSFVIRDAGTTSFRSAAGTIAPQPTVSNMLVGGSLELSGPLITIRPSFDYYYIDRPSIAPLNKLHLGVEVELPLIDIRAGLNQGYYTLGAGVDLGVLRVDVATYGVELGAYPGQQEDRRYIAQVTIDFGFDPGKFGFGGSGSSSERRRLKQRR